MAHLGITKNKNARRTADTASLWGCSRAAPSWHWYNFIRELELVGPSFSVPEGQDENMREKSAFYRLTLSQFVSRFVSEYSVQKIYSQYVRDF